MAMAWVWAGVHGLHVTMAALWVGAMAAALLPPCRLSVHTAREDLWTALRVRAAVWWASLTFVTITGLVLAPVTVPVGRFRLAFGHWFATKMGVVALLFLVFVMFYFRHHLAMRALLRTGGELEGDEEAVYHLRRMNLYTAIALVLAVAAIFLIEIAEYA